MGGIDGYDVNLVWCFFRIRMPTGLVIFFRDSHFKLDIFVVVAKVLNII